MLSGLLHKNLTSLPVVRFATRSDLDAINRVVEAAVMGWRLPERVKRLSLPGYRYTDVDYLHMQMYVAERPDKSIVDVSACEPADVQEVPKGKNGLLLHGIYILPEVQRQGIGSQLLETARRSASLNNMDGLLVKAQVDAS